MTNTSNFANLLNAVKKERNANVKKDYNDPTYYKLEPDAAGNAAAVIRFLPSKDPELLPFVKYFSFSFKNPDTNRWFIENCPSSIGKPSPAMEFNGLLWNEVGTKEAKAQAQRQRRTLNYVANILVVNDPKRPHLNGKVFKYRFGKKIFDKVAEKIDGNELDQPVNVFDLVNGCNFKLRMKTIQVSGSKPQPNYDSSEWDSVSAIVKSQAEADAILEKCHDIHFLESEKNFKSYDELKKRLEYVMGVSQGQSDNSQIRHLISTTQPSSVETVESKGINEFVSAVSTGIPTKFDEDFEAPPKPAGRTPIPSLSVADDDDDDDTSYFAKLAAL